MFRYMINHLPSASIELYKSYLRFPRFKIFVGKIIHIAVRIYNQQGKLLKSTGQQCLTILLRLMAYMYVPRGTNNKFVISLKPIIFKEFILLFFNIISLKESQSKYFFPVKVSLRPISLVHHTKNILKKEIS